MMQDEELFQGFDPAVQARYEQEIAERFGESAREKIAESKERTAGMKNREDFAEIQQDFDRVHRACTDCLEDELPPDAPEVQAVIAEHYAIVARFWTPDAVAYAGLGDSGAETGPGRALENPQK